MSQCCDSLWLPSFVIRNADEMPQGRLQPYYIAVDDDSGVVTWRMEFRSNFYTSLDVQAFVSFLVFLVLEVAVAVVVVVACGEEKKSNTHLLSLSLSNFSIIRQRSPSILRWGFSSIFGFAER